MSLLLLLPLWSATPGPVHARELARWEPLKGCYLGAYIELDDNCRGDIDKFEALVGRKHASYFKYVGYGEPFPHEWVAELKRRQAAAHIAWEPNDGLEAVKDDEYLRGWAQAARFSEAPIFLRYASEMNGTWQPYSGDPELYKEKWRIVARVMHEVAPNVAMVWCPFSMPRRTIEPYYPGDEYVDWVGVNIYSVHHHDGDPTRPGGEDPRDELQYVYDLYADRKPIQICEYGATHFCAACNTWLPSFAVLRARELYLSLPLRFPQVKMINWFSVDTIGEGLAENNYSLTDDPTILAFYRDLITDPYFLDTVPCEPGARPTFIAAAPAPTDEPTSRPPVPSHGVPGERRPATVGFEPTQHLPPPPPADGVRIVIHQSGRAVAGAIKVAIEVGEKVSARWVEVLVDGRMCFISTDEPFRWTWDTRAYANGEHLVEVNVYDANNGLAARDQVRVIVENAHPSS